jgi:hypothetical protein
MAGYQNGMSLYSAYFVPLGLDPLGERWEVDPTKCTIKYIHVLFIKATPPNWGWGELNQWFNQQRNQARQIWNNGSTNIKSSCCEPCPIWIPLFDIEMTLDPSKADDSIAISPGPGGAVHDDDDHSIGIGEVPPRPESLSHEIGHHLGLDHPGAGLPRDQVDEYAYRGQQPFGPHRGEPVDGATDLMGNGRGLRNFYFSAWAAELKRRYPPCDFTPVSR